MTQVNSIQTQPGYFGIHTQLYPEPDDCKIYGWPETLSKVPGLTYFDSLDELRDALGQFAIRVEEFGAMLDPAELERQTLHENQHAKASLLAGFAVTLYGLGVWYEQDTPSNWQLSHYPLRPTRVPTKLSFASIIAAPERLSDGDQEALDNMGYESAADVANRIKIHNETNESIPLAIPLSTL